MYPMRIFPKYQSLMMIVILWLLILQPFTLDGNAAEKSYDPPNLKTISTVKTSKVLAHGVEYTHIERLTHRGPLSIHVLAVSLRDPNIKIDTLLNPTSLMQTSRIDHLVKNSGAIAGMNAGFFEMVSPRYPIGPVIQSNQLLSLDYHFNEYSKSLATFSLDIKNNPLISFWERPTLEILTSKGSSIQIEQYNKMTPYAKNGFSMYDKHWSSTIPSSPTDRSIILIKDQKIIEIGKNIEGRSTLDLDYYLVTPAQNKEFVEKNFSIGDLLTLRWGNVPNIKNLQMAVTGSAPLLIHGVIPSTFSFNIPGSHPRSALGIDIHGNTLTLVTVDGRQKGSIGMSLTELSYLMLELGCFNALNLDGGGSTSMAVKNNHTQKTEIVNSPSDGIARNISTGIGIFAISNSSNFYPQNMTKERLPLWSKGKNIGFELENKRKVFLLEVLP
jgi:exopolysaccharide biosynthesis protein